MRRPSFGLIAMAGFVLVGMAERASLAAELVIRLNVDAAPAPKPVLRYRLLPELREMNPGNPIANYMKCMMQQKQFFFDEEAVERREKLLAMPLKELPAQELKEYGLSVLRQADRAARLDVPDWQTQLRLKTEGFALLIPEVQQLRALARALHVRFRAEIAQGRFDDAIRTAKTMFAMGQHLGDHPTFIGDLVGIAISAITINGLDEMLAQPGCPNLYWALTTLPSPLIPLDKGADGERTSLEWFFRVLSETAPMSKDQLDKFISETDKLFQPEQGTPKQPSFRAWLDAQMKDDSAVSAARARLVECGLSEERLRRFPAEQVVLLDEKRETALRFDDLVKTLSFPCWQADQLAARSPTKQPPSRFADAILPAVRSVRLAQARIDQRIGLLRHVEALRLYAAEHNGALPAKLCNIPQPLPVDPCTGKPFRYELQGQTAHLRGSPPAEREQDPHFNVHYEVTVRQ